MVTQPTTDEMREEIMDSTPDQWEYFDPEPTWVLKSNRDLSIRLLHQYTHEERKIDQPDWASSLPNPTTADDVLRVEFRGAPIDQIKAIQLDEFRITMVYPQREINEETGEEEFFLTEYEAHLSRIMSMDDFDQKMNQLDVAVM
jgi:hypothetical protein